LTRLFEFILSLIRRRRKQKKRIIPNRSCSTCYWAHVTVTGRLVCLAPQVIEKNPHLALCYHVRLDKNLCGIAGRYYRSAADYAVEVLKEA